MKNLYIVALCAFLLVGCETAGNKQIGGAVLGGAAGGLLGAQFGSGSGRLATTALGAVGGLLLGSSIGQSLDDVDRMKHNQTAQRALEYKPTNESTSWRNPDSGNSGQLTPTRTFQRSDGAYCREYNQVITVNGREEEAYGTACRQPDGSWKITS